MKSVQEIDSAQMLKDALSMSVGELMKKYGIGSGKATALQRQAALEQELADSWVYDPLAGARVEIQTPPVPVGMIDTLDLHIFGGQSGGGKSERQRKLQHALGLSPEHPQIASVASISIDVPRDRIDYLLGNLPVEDAVAWMLSLSESEKFEIWLFVIQRRISKMCGPCTEEIATIGKQLQAFAIPFGNSERESAS